MGVSAKRISVAAAEHRQVTVTSSVIPVTGRSSAKVTSVKGSGVAVYCEVWLKPKSPANSPKMILGVQRIAQLVAAEKVGAGHPGRRGQLGFAGGEAHVDDTGGGDLQVEEAGGHAGGFPYSGESRLEAGFRPLKIGRI